MATLTGPTIRSHPWAEMLAGRKPDVSLLANAVPEDFYFVEFHSLTKLLDAMDVSDLWGTHLFNQAFREARTSNTGERLKRQLALESNPLLRPFYDLVVEEVAVTGSDLFLREGSDVTLLFRVRQPEIFKARMDGFLTNAEQSRADAKRITGNYLGVEYVHLATPDREINVFAADPAPGLHVRSNSQIAFQRILEAIKGQAVRRLGESDEFAYIRALMPRGAQEEDGFVYLSDPFIRRLVGPQLKLTERRRMLCYNHLRMIAHAALLYRTEHGRPPASLEDLAQANCSPGLFGQGDLSCPDGGRYALSVDGATGVCSHHGHAHYLTPNIEIPVAQVTGEEADEYKAFLDEYNQYWRTFFDPIALRVKITPQQYRLETIVLPLMDNSIYTGLAGLLGGAPEPLDALPVPLRNIFSVGVRVNKEPLLATVAGMEQEFGQGEFLRGLGIPGDVAGTLNVTEFLSQGIGNQVAFHVYDAHPTFDLNVPNMLGLIAGTTAGRVRSPGSTELLIGLALASLNTPVYLSIPVRDAQVVDRFLERLDAVLAAMARQQERGGGFGFEQDFFTFPLDQGPRVRGFGLRFGPIKLRFFWARIGGGLYVASKPFILEDLAAVSPPAEVKTDDQVSIGHAMVHVRPQNWNHVLPDYRLSWAENDREACLNNLGFLTGLGRALSGDGVIQNVRESADRLYGVHFFCPEGGDYGLSADGQGVACSVHGSAFAPKQPTAPSERSAAGKLMSGLTTVTATLNFTHDGLRAVVMIERK